jgi:hypothetical protein
LAIRYEMARLAREVGVRQGRFFLTRDVGEKAYEPVRRQLQQTPDGEPLVLVFPPAQLIDSSFADEVIVRIGKEIFKGEHGERGILLEGLTDDSIKNVNAVISLNRIKLPLLAVESASKWRIIGHLEEHLVETLNLVFEHHHLTASELVALRGLAVNTASTRLKRLHNMHLVRRDHEITDKGLQYIYHFWEWCPDKARAV